MNIKELVVAIVVAHVVMEVAKFVGAFVFFVIYDMMCERNKSFCKNHLNCGNKKMREWAQKIYHEKWEPLDKLKEECEKIIVGFNRFTIDG